MSPVAVGIFVDSVEPPSCADEVRAWLKEGFEPRGKIDEVLGEAYMDLVNNATRSRGSDRMREPWKAERRGDSILQADENIPPERVQGVLSVTQKVQKGLDASLEGNPIGKPEAAIIILRWGEGESAVIAEPATTRPWSWGRCGAR